MSREPWVQTSMSRTPFVSRRHRANFARSSRSTSSAAARSPRASVGTRYSSRSNAVNGPSGREKSITDVCPSAEYSGSGLTHSTRASRPASSARATASRTPSGKWGVSGTSGCHGLGSSNTRHRFQLGADPAGRSPASREYILQSGLLASRAVSVTMQLLPRSLGGPAVR